MRARKAAVERREEVVEAALRLAGEVGPERLTTAAIADAVGVTQAAVFRHFPKKQDIWDAVAARIAERLDAAWTGALGDAATPAARLAALVQGQLAMVQATPALPAILFSRELHIANPALRAAFLGLMRRFVAHLAGTVESGRADGSFRADLDPHDAAFVVLAMMQGLIVRWSLAGRDFDLQTEGKRLVAVLLRGILAGGHQP